MVQLKFPRIELAQCRTDWRRTCLLRIFHAFTERFHVVKQSFLYFFQFRKHCPLRPVGGAFYIFRSRFVSPFDFRLDFAGKRLHQFLDFFNLRNNIFSCGIDFFVYTGSLLLVFYDKLGKFLLQPVGVTFLKGFSLVFVMPDKRRYLSVQIGFPIWKILVYLIFVHLKIFCELFLKATEFLHHVAKRKILQSVDFCFQRLKFRTDFLRIRLEWSGKFRLMLLLKRSKRIKIA